jgi:hypothetical protein
LAGIHSWKDFENWNPPTKTQQTTKQGRATNNGGVPGKELSNVGMGFTLGYGVNENLNLTFSYKSTLDDDAPDDLRMDVFMVTLVFGWHPIIEGSRRLQGQE